jgi:hypothetical protein
VGKTPGRNKIFQRTEGASRSRFLEQNALWDLDEATALSFDKDPRFVNWSNIGPHVNDSPFADQYSKLRLIVLRAENAGDLSNRVLPGDFVSWAEKTGVDLPTGLKKAVRAAVQRIEDRESIIAENAERDSIFARPLAFRRMQTFSAVPERGRNLEAVPMTTYALSWNPLKAIEIA